LVARIVHAAVQREECLDDVLVHAWSSMRVTSATSFRAFSALRVFAPTGRCFF
jgi:hypothetical protein